MALGEFAAWIIGWGLTLQCLLSSCTVSVGWSGYFCSLLKDFGITLPEAISKAPLHYDVATGWHTSGSIINLPAVLLILLLGVLVSIGTKAAASVNNVLVVIKLAVVLLFIGCGIGFVNWDNFSLLT